MIRRLGILAPVTLAASCSPVAGGPSQPPPAAALQTGCDSPTYHALDFWLGTWDVTDPHGAYEGTNVIAPTLGHCAVEEHWVDARGHRGDSLFYVDRASGEWRQVWVTDEGPMKEKRQVGGAPSGGVRFEGPDRTTLVPLPGGTVRQVIEGSRGAWEGIYTRVPRQCDAPGNRQMDFWLGDWSVQVRTRTAPDSETWTAAVGSNHVTSVLNGCAIEERFVATGGPNGASWSGRSHSTWVPAEKRWRQTWVDDSGSYLAFTGGMQGGEFVLVGEPRPDGKVMRMVFGEIRPDHITWRWERSVDGQKTWRPMMIIEYARIGA